jgi:transcription antitermination factor NusG
MDWFHGINWFAIHVKRFRESVAASSVAALGLEVFLPMVKVQPLERFAVKGGSKPLFAGYFFARFNPEISLGPVECAQGVLRVIKSGLCPIPVEDQVVREIQNRMEEDGLIRLQRRELRPGDRVSIEEGLFAGMMGRVEAELDDRWRVAIFLETLWNARVLIEKRWVGLETA